MNFLSLPTELFTFILHKLIHRGLSALASFSYTCKALRDRITTQEEFWLLVLHREGLNEGVISTYAPVATILGWLPCYLDWQRKKKRASLESSYAFGSVDFLQHLGVHRKVVAAVPEKRGFFQNLLSLTLTPSKHKKLLFLGLDGAGKTTILYSLKLGEVVTCGYDSCGFSVETITYKNLLFDIWVVGGNDRVRQLWQFYAAGTDALVWVVDGADHDRLDESRIALHDFFPLLPMTLKFVLVFVNKQDLKPYRSGVMGALEVAVGLDLFSLSRGTRQVSWWVQPSNGWSREDLYSGMEKLYLYCQDLV